MPMDTFICGTCQSTYNDIELFMEHKKQKCDPPQEHIVHIIEQADGSVVQSSAEEAAVQVITEVGPGVEESILDEATQSVQLIQVPVSEGVRLTKEQAEAVVRAANQSTDALEGSGPTFLRLSSPLVLHDAPGDAVPPEIKTPAPKPPGRKRGRPRKGMEKNKPVVKVEQIANEQEGPSVNIDNDGRLHCPKCKKTFMRLRHYNSHRCLAETDYVDITKKDSLPDFENEADSEPENDLDAPVVSPKASPRAKKAKIVPLSTDSVNSAVEALDSGETDEPNVRIETNEDPEFQDEDSDSFMYASSTTAPVKERPIFANLEDKKSFEENLNIDLSQIDHMFKTHVIEQNVNEHAPPPANRVTPELTIYSCNTCDKVFKTVSHMRGHCLIHTNLKPFKCPKCPYASNSKGNLYTHIRKHTGQFFQCQKCEFKSVNKAHLAEHMGTHTIRKIKCRICKKEYSTNKSLYNHVRKYHSRTQEGINYMKEFTPRVNKGQAVLHQCHICNRKFKKKQDRDRHLFIHNIRSNPNVFACDLCNYTASRSSYLENHIRKHRVVYQCAVCQQKFLSTIRLNDHISEVHIGEAATQPCTKDWGDLFEASINCSLYLPEPDGTIDHLGGNYVKLGTQKGDTMQDPKLTTEEDNQALVELQDAIQSTIKAEEGIDPVPSVVLVDFPGLADSISEPETQQNPTHNDVPSSIVSKISDAPIPSSSRLGVVTLSADMISNLNLNKSSITEVQSQDSETSTSQAKDPNPQKTDDWDIPTVLSSVVKSEPKVVDQEGEIVSGPVQQVDESAYRVAEGPENAVPRDEHLQEDAGTGEKNGEEVESVEGPVISNVSVIEQEETPKVDIFEKLEYKSMSMGILTKLRETFGNQECEFCGRLFYSQLDYEPHVRTHTGDKPFACEDCDYRSITRENLKRHREKHHQHIALKCERCDFVATSRTQLWTHEHKHKETEQPSNMCPVCQETFSSKKTLGAHILTTHPDMSREDAKKVTGYNHRILGKLGRRSYKCPYCDKLFTRANSDLQKHIWIHEGIKPFKCDLCPHACRSMNNLKNHMLRHSQTKPFQCGDCGKLYKSRTALRWHMRCHREGRLFKCQRCPYEAIQKSHLKRHMETHDIIKKFVCEHCEYSANSLGYMKIHYTKFHQGVPYREDGTPNTPILGLREMPPNTKAFKCLSCDYIFGNIWDIKKHLKVRHHLHIEDIRALESGATCIVPADTTETEPSDVPHGIEVIEVNNIADTTQLKRQTDEEEAREALETMQYSVPGGDMDPKTVNAVNILQQLFDMSQQGAGQTNSQELTIRNQDGEMVTVDPEMIIVQNVSGEDGQGLATGDFVIQVMSQGSNPDAEKGTVATSAEDLLIQVVGDKEGDKEVVCTQAQDVQQTVLVPQSMTEVLTVGSEFFQSMQQVIQPAVTGNVVTMETMQEQGIIQSVTSDGDVVTMETVEEVMDENITMETVTEVVEPVKIENTDCGPVE